MDKLYILAGSKFRRRVHLSAGVQRPSQKGAWGLAQAASCCHSFAPGWSAITLLRAMSSQRLQPELRLNPVSSAAPVLADPPSPRSWRRAHHQASGTFVEGCSFSSGVLGLGRTGQARQWRACAPFSVLLQRLHPCTGVIPASPELSKLRTARRRRATELDVGSRLSVSLRHLLPGQGLACRVTPRGPNRAGRREERNRLLAPGRASAGTGNQVTWAPDWAALRTA